LLGVGHARGTWDRVPRDRVGHPRVGVGHPRVRCRTAHRVPSALRCAEVRP
jgi:hypothetical protein